MATIEESIRNHLVGSAVVGPLVGSRVYPTAAPKGKGFPNLVFRQTGQDEETTAQTPDGNLIGAIFTFMASAESPAAAKAVIQAVRRAFKNFCGVMGGGVYVSGIDSLSGLIDDAVIKEDTVLFYTTEADVQIWYQEVPLT